jgi:hypothetical protein
MQRRRRGRGPCHRRVTRSWRRCERRTQGVRPPRRRSAGARRTGPSGGTDGWDRRVGPTGRTRPGRAGAGRAGWPAGPPRSGLGALYALDPARGRCRRPRARCVPDWGRSTPTIRNTAGVVGPALGAFRIGGALHPRSGTQAVSSAARPARSGLGALYTHDPEHRRCPGAAPVDRPHLRAPSGGGASRGCARPGRPGPGRCCGGACRGGPAWPSARSGR